MIRISLHRSGEKITGFECKGHAGYAQEGSDIVCAAVSVLTTTCINALESVAGVEPAVEVAEGYMKAQLPASSSHDAQIILQCMRQGLSDLAEQYPRYLRLTEI